MLILGCDVMYFINKKKFISLLCSVVLMLSVAEPVLNVNAESAGYEGAGDPAPR